MGGFGCRLPALAVILVCLAGCAPKQYYRFTRINGVPAIAPPGVKDSDRAVTVRVAGAGIPAERREPGCAVSLQDFRLEWRGRAMRDAVITVNLDTLVPDGAYDEVARAAFEAFRVELGKLERRNGCLAPLSGELIAARVSEALPMPFQDVPFYRNGYDVFKSSVDLRPGMRILQQAVADGAGKTRPVETDTVHYRVLPSAGGAKIEAVRATSAQPVVPLPELNGEPSHYRLFLRTRFLKGALAGTERHAVLVGAPDFLTLAAATAEFLKDPDSVCAGAVGPAACTVFPHRVTVGPEVPVTVRGRPAYVDISTGLGAVLPKQQGRVPPQALQTLKVRRQFAGRHIPVDLKGAGALAFTLPLVAGDRIEW